VEFYIDIVLDKYLLREIAATALKPSVEHTKNIGEPASVLEAFESKTCVAPIICVEGMASIRKASR
jgi:hypothetical protein